jgi:hypothetical protein
LITISFGKGERASGGYGAKFIGPTVQYPVNQGPPGVADDDFAIRKLLDQIGTVADHAMPMLRERVAIVRISTQKFLPRN